MDTKELKLSLKETEGYKIEFKESPGNIDKDMVAFANSSGGRIFVGITDKGEDKGVRITNKLKAQVQDIARNCDPAVEVILDSCENIYEYPFEAIREAVINCVMHKDYFEHGHNNILKFFPDRIQIENIWIKPHNFILGKTIFRRNQIIADLFSRIHFGEKIGSGMKRMQDICEEENAPYPKIEYTDTHFYIVFKQSREYLKMAGVEEKVGERLGETLGERLGENQIKIITLISKNRYITTKELSGEIGISTTAIENNIAKLKKEGILKRIGPAKGGHWEVVEK